MNLIIPDSWLKEFLKTKASPKQIADALSLCAASVENVERLKDDHLYYVEVTTNRVDMASIFGLAREAAAVLPRLGIKTELKPPPEIDPIFKFKYRVNYLEVKISDPTLCPRFTAVLLEKVTIKPSPPLILERLAKCGIRALNNVVDISNYVMLEMGQPMHTFDYDKIISAKMLMRLSQKGESITTLDGVKRRLFEGSIIIEDGQGRIIDLCGIMGGENSAISDKTSRVLLFVQTYDPFRIRQTCQKMAFRTEAASLFEKSLDPENVPLALYRAVSLLEQTTQGRTKREIIDIYPKPYAPKKIRLETDLVQKMLGIQISEKEVIRILASLGFTCQLSEQKSELIVTIPSFRSQDINLTQDLIEEVARLYGYHNLPSSLPMGAIPQNPPDRTLFWEEKAKRALKYWGFCETCNYSMVSEEILLRCGFNPHQTLKIANPLTEDLVYMRISLMPSLLLAYQKNQNLEEMLHLFELSKVYLPCKNDLPDEKSMLSGVLSGEKFLEAKGVVESLFSDLGIKNLQFSPYTIHSTPYTELWHTTRTALVKTENGEILGIIGEILPQVLEKFEIKGRVSAFDLDFSQINQIATDTKVYRPLPKYPPIVEDLAVIANAKVLTAEIIKTFQSISPLISEVFLWDVYENTRTFRLTYQSLNKTLKNKEVQKIRQKVLERLEKNFSAEIKTLNNS